MRDLNEDGRRKCHEEGEREGSRGGGVEREGEREARRTRYFVLPYGSRGGRQDLHCYPSRLGGVMSAVCSIELAGAA